MTAATDNRTAHQAFEHAIAAGIHSTVCECWSDFMCWEVARRFADDPSHPAKAAIEWIQLMGDLRSALDEFQGDAKSDCVVALDNACEYFAKLDHAAELIHAIETWTEYRREERDIRG